MPLGGVPTQYYIAREIAPDAQTTFFIHEANLRPPCETVDSTQVFQEYSILLSVVKRMFERFGIRILKFSPRRKSSRKTRELYFAHLTKWF